MAGSTAPAAAADGHLEVSAAQLSAAVGETVPFLRRCTQVRGEVVADHHGGDVVAWRSKRNVHRHVGNYLTAAHVGALAAEPRRYLDVGCGVGALAAWVADRLSAELELVDADPTMRAIASDAFGDASVLASLEEAAPADLVTALEVVEHVAPEDQLGFITALFDRVAPGGRLVLSTPDESRYPFGHSGYQPHIGTLDAAELRALLEEATGQPAEVWRIDGGSFDASRGRLWWEWLVNHVWAAVGAPVDALARLLIRRTRKAGVAPDLADDTEAISLQVEGHRPVNAGTGLIVRVTKPR